MQEGDDEERASQGGDDERQQEGEDVAMDEEPSAAASSSNSRVPQGLPPRLGTESAREGSLPAEDWARTPLQECFPHHHWRPIKGKRYRVQLEHGPAKLGLARISNPEDDKDTRMTCGVHLFDPMRWYLQEITWMAPGEGPGTTAVEMALDFEATT